MIYTTRILNKNAVGGKGSPAVSSQKIANCSRGRKGRWLWRYRLYYLFWPSGKIKKRQNFSMKKKGSPIQLFQVYSKGTQEFFNYANRAWNIFKSFSSLRSYIVCCLLTDNSPKRTPLLSGRLSSANTSHKRVFFLEYVPQILKN